MSRPFVLFCLALLAVPRAASADWHITPMIGLTMLGDTSLLDPERASDNRHLNAGLAVAWLSRGIFGVESSVTWTPGFFEAPLSAVTEIPVNDFITTSGTISVMANVLVTLPQLWTEYGLRPFVSGGVGLLRAKAESSVALFPFDVNTTGFNIGGGAVGFLSPRTGVRFDLRYHSTLNRTGDDAPSFGPVHLRYVTASVGFVLRR